MQNETACLSQLLNNQKANCTKIKTKTKEIEIINGAILVNGNHTIDNHYVN